MAPVRPTDSVIASGARQGGAWRSSLSGLPCRPAAGRTPRNDTLGRGALFAQAAPAGTAGKGRGASGAGPTADTTSLEEQLRQDAAGLLDRINNIKRAGGTVDVALESDAGAVADTLRDLGDAATAKQLNDALAAALAAALAPPPPPPSPQTPRPSPRAVSAVGAGSKPAQADTSFPVGIHLEGHTSGFIHGWVDGAVPPGTGGAAGVELRGIPLYVVYRLDTGPVSVNSGSAAQTRHQIEVGVPSESRLRKKGSILFARADHLAAITNAIKYDRLRGGSYELGARTLNGLRILQLGPVGLGVGLSQESLIYGDDGALYRLSAVIYVNIGVKNPGYKPTHAEEQIARLALAAGHLYHTGNVTKNMLVPIAELPGIADEFGKVGQAAGLVALNSGMAQHQLGRYSLEARGLEKVAAGVIAALGLGMQIGGMADKNATLATAGATMLCGTGPGLIVNLAGGAENKWYRFGAAATCGAAQAGMGIGYLKATDGLQAPRTDEELAVKDGASKNMAMGLVLMGVGAGGVGAGFTLILP